jgi:FtsZ-interacting cell division protein ZipA
VREKGSKELQTLGITMLLKNTLPSRGTATQNLKLFAKLSFKKVEKRALHPPMQGQRSV